MSNMFRFVECDLKRGEKIPARITHDAREDDAEIFRSAKAKTNLLTPRDKFMRAIP
ncbi:MAG: hypothetical protein P4M15_07660 [Alphaproteobacteria bacterium]|nr:hypothetical protein [Alphaproteobacteria bacterium]